MSLQIFLAASFDSVLLIVCAFAAIKGGRPERIGAAINVIATAATFVLRLQSAFGPTFAEILIFAIDVSVTAGFFWLGVRTIRFWPIWAAGFALGNLFVSIFGALLPSVPLFAYLTGLGIYAYLALGVLALGTLRIPRDAAPYLRNGSRRSWLQHQRTTT